MLLLLIYSTKHKQKTFSMTHSNNQETTPVSSPEKPRNFQDRIKKFGAVALSKLGLNMDFIKQKDLDVERLRDIGFAKEAPILAAQLATRQDRTNLVESNASYAVNVLQDLEVAKEAQVMTEGEALMGLADFLTAASATEALGEETNTIADEMLEKLAFIGETEMTEATKGLAAYFKQTLDSDENTQLLFQIIDTAAGAGSDGRSSKSAGRVMQKVLDNFSEKEIDEYGNRIIFDAYKANPDMHTKAILLDDWTISGTQMRQMHSNLSSYWTERIDEIEACLVVAPAELIEKGLQVYEGRIPVKAFYKAATAEHHYEFEERVVKSDIYPGYVTGAHSSPDFNFDYFIGKLVKSATEKVAQGEPMPDVLLKMPPLTQVTRSTYKSENIHPRIEQINRINGASYYDESGRIIFQR